MPKIADAFPGDKREKGVYKVRRVFHPAGPGTNQKPYRNGDIIRVPVEIAERSPHLLVRQDTPQKVENPTGGGDGNETHTTSLTGGSESEARVETTTKTSSRKKKKKRRKRKN